MEDRWDEISYNRFPSFTSAFERSAYEEWGNCDNDDTTEEETEDWDCLD